METFFHKKYISREPIRYLFDVYSIGFVFKFSKQISITPILKYEIKNKSCKKSMNIVNTNVDGLHKIVYGPLSFDENNEINNPSTAILLIKLNDKSKKIIFKKKIKLLKFNDFTVKPYINKMSVTTFAVFSCFNLRKFYEPGQTDFKTLQKMNDTCKKKNPLMIISSGDIIYFENLNTLSSYGIQNAYDNLITLNESKSLWSNYTWVCVNDDHELSPNNGMMDSLNIKLLRKKLDENFPIGEQDIDPNNCRATYFSIRGIHFITLDTVTGRTYNVNSTSPENRYSSILGEEQLNYLKNVLSNIIVLNGSSALIFIVVGKSMFGSSRAFPDSCVKEKEQIFDYIKTFKLKNVCFICGDSHFSDFTEYKLDNLTIREIRNSSVSSAPRIPSDSENPYQYPNSLSKGVNNFGMVDVYGKSAYGSESDYNITYTNYTLNGEQFKYTWKMEA